MPPEVVENPPAPAAVPPAPPIAPPTAAVAAPVTPPAKEPTLAEHEQANRSERRHRARSQEAGPEDVPRIRNLTTKNRELQAEIDRLKSTPPAAAVASTTPAAAKPATPAPAAATPAPAPRTASTIAAPGVIPVAAADKDPEPDPAAYVDDPSKNYVKDQARWEARQEIRDANERARVAHLEQTTAAEKDRLSKDWSRRDAIAKGRYADFAAVAYAPTRIPQGSMIDNYIVEAEAGLDVLYHLQKHPAELDAMLALSMFDPATGSYPQLEALSSLARRLAPGHSSAVDTGSAATVPPVARLPRPPNPVRTGPMSVATDDPPGDDASLAQHEAHWGKKRR